MRLYWAILVVVLGVLFNTATSMSPSNNFGYNTNIIFNIGSDSVASGDVKNTWANQIENDLNKLISSDQSQENVPKSNSMNWKNEIQNGLNQVIEENSETDTSAFDSSSFNHIGAKKLINSEFADGVNINRDELMDLDISNPWDLIIDIPSFDFPEFGDKSG